jgi:hypothetical protein
MSSPSRSLFTPGGNAAASSEAPIPAIVAQVVAHLRLAKPSMLHEVVTTDTLRECLKEMKLTAADRAELDVWMHSTAPSAASRAMPPTSRFGTSSSDPAAIIANAFSRSTDHQQFPWMAAEEAARRNIAALHQEYANDKTKALEALRTLFASKARIGTLGHVENLVGQYVLYAPDLEYATFLLMAILLKMPKDARISTHNWLVAGDMPRSDVETFGAAIAVLTAPLYPPAAPLASLNQQLLESVPLRRDAVMSQASHVAGGSAAPDILDLINAPAHQAPPSSVSGAGVLPVQQYGEGYGVDMSPVEAAVNNLQTQISALQKQKTALQRQARSQHQYQPQVAAQPRNPAQQFYQQHRGRGGRGGRGRGRDWPRAAGADHSAAGVSADYPSIEEIFSPAPQGQLPPPKPSAPQRSIPPAGF